MNMILPFLKYWKFAGVAVLAAACLLSFYFARSRGEKLEIAERTIESERDKFQAQLKDIEKARQDEKERDGFRKTQNKKIKLADDAALHDAYDGLRARRAGGRAD